MGLRLLLLLLAISSVLAQQPYRPQVRYIGPVVLLFLRCFEFFSCHSFFFLIDFGLFVFRHPFFFRGSRVYLESFQGSALGWLWDRSKEFKYLLHLF
ncbi:hypothetical protein BDN70DRAFT_66500 [Pholiota conissans]|uniref:Secreted protein n=1 Tax=Pholiota conissans TaxID=109636 RepID=A0A9P5YYS8_9AGAR|nr:hypothetical protein BDN70DRAFT_66500 [Pholiota conissans]